jgi:hypothetical protein
MNIILILTLVLLSALGSSIYGQKPETGWLRGVLMMENTHSNNIVIYSRSSATDGAVVALMTATDTLFSILPESIMARKCPAASFFLKTSH